jgi:ketosteroid isomerase-like protein
MKTTIQLFRELYENFNNRQIDLVITKMTPDVKWANGMDGGYVYGHDGVREYWTRQFKIIKSQVTPLQIEVENSSVKIKVHQIVHDLEGNLQADELVVHHFNLTNGKISEFVIGSKENHI